MNDGRNERARTHGGSEPQQRRPAADHCDCARAGRRRRRVDSSGSSASISLSSPPSPCTDLAVLRFDPGPKVCWCEQRLSVSPPAIDCSPARRADSKVRKDSRLRRAETDPPACHSPERLVQLQQQHATGAGSMGGCECTLLLVSSPLLRFVRATTVPLPLRGRLRARFALAHCHPSHALSLLLLLRCVCQY
jgi:hypothetical protein